MSIYIFIIDLQYHLNLYQIYQSGQINVFSIWGWRHLTSLTTRIQNSWINGKVEESIHHQIFTHSSFISHPENSGKKNMFIVFHCHIFALIQSTVDIHQNQAPVEICPYGFGLLDTLPSSKSLHLSGHLGHDLKAMVSETVVTHVQPGRNQIWCVVVFVFNMSWRGTLYCNLIVHKWLL